ncbi:MAG TPA: efflux RND transporter periplasmic adaptor subunit [Candidatus Binataceae bacterium]|nr:efflux RND transporter periplasmic adaptor subunit [Candidatus Binataceae bacterium]
MSRCLHNSAVMVVLIAAIFFGGCRSEPASDAAAPEPTPWVPILVKQGGLELLEMKPDAVLGAKIVSVENAELPGVLETSGQITFDDRRVSTIVSRVQGRIEQTRLSLWDNVKRGEKIAALYSPDFMTAEAEFIQARDAAKRGQNGGLSGANDISASLLAAARRKLELLGMEDADIRAISAPNPTVWMRAPISGLVVDNKAVRGAAVNPGDVLYSLGTLDDVWITADIYEDDISRVSVGQELEAVTAAFPDRIFKGMVARISPGIDPTTHTAQIRCEVKNPDGSLKPQMLARVKIVIHPGEATVVPQDALVFDVDSYFAFVEVSPNVFEHRKVSVAPWEHAGYVRVGSGLRAGDRVITGETLQVNALWHMAHGESSGDIQ